MWTFAVKRGCRLDLSLRQKSYISIHSLSFPFLSVLVLTDIIKLCHEFRFPLVIPIPIAIAIPLQPTPVLTNSAAHPETDLVPVLPVDQATDTAPTLVLALETDQTATAEEEIATEETGTGTGTTEIVPIDEEIDPGFHLQLYMEGGAMVPPGNLGRNQSGDQ